MKEKTIIPLLALLAADGISMSGNAMATIAIPWFVLESTGSVTSTALSGAAGVLPIVIAAIVGGVWVDRVGHQRASVYSDLASGVTIALIPILYALGWLTFPVLLLLVFCGALLDAPGAAARGALVPNVARIAGWRLESVNSAHEVIESGSGLVGPLLGGLLIAAISAQNVLLVDALSFILSAALVAFLIPGFFRRRAQQRETAAETPTPEEEEAQYEQLGVWAAFRAGVSYVWTDGPLRAIFGSAIFMNFILAPVFGLLLPVFLRDVAQSPEGLGAVVAAFGGGAVLGAIVYGVWGIAGIGAYSFWWATAPSARGLSRSPGCPLCLARWRLCS